MVLVRMLLAYKGYNPGEVIGRDQAQADELVEKKIAEHVSEAEWLASKEPAKAEASKAEDKPVEAAPSKFKR